MIKRGHGSACTHRLTEQIDHAVLIELLRGGGDRGPGVTVWKGAGDGVGGGGKRTVSAWVREAVGIGSVDGA